MTISEKLEQLKKENNICIQCGKCCKELFPIPDDITEEDISLWESLGKYDIYQTFLDMEKDLELNILDFCKFLKQIDENKTICLINDIKPSICKNYSPVYCCRLINSKAIFVSMCGFGDSKLSKYENI